MATPLSRINVFRTPLSSLLRGRLLGMKEEGRPEEETSNLGQGMASF